MQTIQEGIKLIAQRAEAYLVGGYVRDALLGIVSDDADLEVYHLPVEALQSLLEELFPGRVHLVGRQFGVFHIPCSNGTLDVALPRRESKTAPGHRGFEVTGDPNMTFEDAARRRDFTINAILQNPLTGELIDPYDGKTDLEARRLRVVSKETFVEDPLRLYRAAQFVARFGLDVDGESLELLKTMNANGSLDELPPERITDELKKLLLSDKPSIGFELLKNIGVIGKYYPELAKLKDTPQDPEWHPEGDVWIHTMMVVDQAANIATRENLNDEQRLLCVLGALCHDLGKALTTAPMEKDGVIRMRSLGHEKAGIEPTRELLGRLTFGHDVNQFCEHVAHYHLQPTALYREFEKKNLTETGYENAVRKFLKKILPYDWKTFLAACEADYRGRTLPDIEKDPFEIGKKFAGVIQKYKLDEAAKTLLVTGEELIQLGVQPGKHLGDLLRAIENARDEERIKTKEEAFAFLQQEGLL
ncbi:MAG: HD domain-containing protein [Patescibacteria group bacterium]